MDSVKLLTYQQVSEFYNVTTRTVRTWADKGAITVVRTPSGQPRVPADACVAAGKMRKSAEESGS